MTSTLKVDKIEGVSTAGSISITGEGNSTTTNLQQGLCKMFVSIDGEGTIAIIDSNNVASITDHATAVYGVSYTNNMGVATYPVTGSVVGSDSANFFSFLTSAGAGTLSTSAVQIQLVHYTGAEPDNDPTHILSHGDLA